MKQNDRSRLTSALQQHVARIAADLRAKMRAEGPERERARKLHADERVGEDFEVWTDLLSRRGAVLWVLKSVYVRVLEDRGLLKPGRLLDPEAQQLFEKLAPHLGETAFLRWIYKDLASRNGGLPELFSPQPAEVALPSDELSRALIAFWRFRDADTGAHWSFAEEKFEGELMGDLYQELDPVVKDRFALCQTPDFVRAFILDRTLTPAIETFGADKVRLIDPACGSGHFLIDGLKRLVAATSEVHRDWARGKVVAHVLDRVVGIDLNDYACALARTRLIMTAAELAGVTTLADAAGFHPHVYWADGLEQVERDDVKKPVQGSLFEKVEEKPRASLTRSDVRAALKKVFQQKFHAVVANPPYVVERDEARKAYHRELIGKARRYVSATGKYSLASPFTERCFQLAEPGGFVGLITSNNFMKREFGRALIEQVLARIDLSLVVDTSQAYIPFHGTPTVLLFGRNQKPAAGGVQAVMGKRGETATPELPATGRVWSSIVESWGSVGFENEFVSVDVLPRNIAAKHPWSLGGGGAADLKSDLESRGDHTLGDVAAAVGITCVTGEDDVYLLNPEVASRLRVGRTKPLVTGEKIRDWCLGSAGEVVFTYDERLRVLAADQVPTERRYLQPFATKLKQRRRFGTPMLQRGLSWYELQELYPDKLHSPLTIAFAFVATHNHFVLDRGGKVFKQSAPVIKLPPGATEDDHLALLGLLNSSTLGYWMRQVFHIKGGESTGKKRQSEAWSRRLEYDATKLRGAPVVSAQRERIIALAKRIDSLARDYSSLSAPAVLNRPWNPADLTSTLAHASTEQRRIRDMLVTLQEELDWTVYVAFGLAPESELTPLEDIEPMASEHRPFAIHLARLAAAREATNYWFEAMDLTPSPELPPTYSRGMQTRVDRRLALLSSDPNLALIETPEAKRKWEPTDPRAEVESAICTWLGSRIEKAVAVRSNASTLPQLVAAIQDDAHLLAALEHYQGRRDVDVSGFVAQIFDAESVPEHPFHIYTVSGLAKREAWEEVWRLQRREDAGEAVDTVPVPPEYSQGSRGKTTDFLRTEYWHLRGKLDVPKERFIAFTEVPGRSGSETLYGWAGWTPLQRLKAILSIDEELEDAGTPLADRIALLDSGWRLLPDIARDDPAAATRLKAELQALVGPEGPSKELLEDWRKRFPPPGSRAAKARKPAKAVAEVTEESDES